MYSGSDRSKPSITAKSVAWLFLLRKGAVWSLFYSYNRLNQVFFLSSSESVLLPAMVKGMGTRWANTNFLACQRQEIHSSINEVVYTNITRVAMI
jgi:hypothetical protein